MKCAEISSSGSASLHHHEHINFKKEPGVLLKYLWKKSLSREKLLKANSMGISSGPEEFKTIYNFLKGVFKTMFDFLKGIFKRKNPGNLEGLLSKEELLRFSIIQKEMSLEKAKTELAKFLKKGKK